MKTIFLAALLVFAGAALAQQPFVNIAVSPQSVALDEPATLSWNTGGSGYVSIEPGIGQVSIAGSMIIAPRQTTTYTITAINEAGTTQKSATLKVAQPQARRPAMAQKKTTITVGKTDIISSFINRFRQVFIG